MAFSEEFTSGLPDDFDLTVEAARFRTDENYNSGKSLVLVWDGTSSSPEFNEAGKPVFITIGTGWVSRDGITIEREDPNSKKQFNKSTRMAYLIRRVNEWQIGDLLASRGGSEFSAKTWEGLTFHMKRLILDTSQADAKDTLFPERFVGVASGASATSVPAATGAVNGAATGLRDQVVALFKASADFATAQATVLALPGVTEDQALLNDILTPDGLWTQVKAAA